MGAQTANWTQRKNYGWYQVWARVMPWCWVTVPGAAWFSFGWWSDDWKKKLTLGIWEPPLVHWDSNMTNFRTDFVKYHAQYPGIPYKRARPLRPCAPVAPPRTTRFRRPGR